MMRAPHLLLPLALLLAGYDYGADNWGSSDRFRNDFHMTYPLKAGGRVSVENFNGAIEISAWDRDEVDVSGTRYARTKELLDQLKVDVVPTADAVRIRTLRPSTEGRWRGGYGVKYIIKVPRRTELDRIESANGALTLDGTEGNARLKTSNGAVKVNAISGTLNASTTNGAIELRNVAGDADLSSSNGGIRAHQHKGAISASTSNGGIRLEFTSITGNKPVRADTTNGNIEIHAEALNGNDIRAESNNGGITLRLPADVKATVKARTSNARVNSAFEVSSTFTGEKKNRLEGAIRGGGPLLDLSTSNGSINLEKR
jgi:hypothetical protein